MNPNEMYHQSKEPLRHRINYSREHRFPPPGQEIEMFDGLPRYPFDQSLTTYGASSNVNNDVGDIVNHPPSFAVQPPQTEWIGGFPSYSQSPFPGYYSDSTQVNTGGNTQGFILGKQDTILTSHDHIIPQSHRSTVPFHIAREVNLRPQLLTDSVKQYRWDYMAGGRPVGYETHAGARGPLDSQIGSSLGMESQPGSASPYAFENTPPVTDLSSSKSSEDGEGDDATSAYGERSSDEPYAKLIYRALLAAPNHAMNLQDIYQWFLRNTDKGSLTSAGWRNSIRHNLSMNAAFRKTERPLAGDETKKSSAWVLEPSAIENGVTPTTRYRKTGKKNLKAENPAPARVRSGRAGGLSAGKAKIPRQRRRGDRQEVPAESPSDYSASQWRLQHPTPAPTNYHSHSPSLPIKQEFTAPLNMGMDYTNYTTAMPYSYQFPILNPQKASLDAPWTFQDVEGVHMDGGPLFYQADHDAFWDNQPQLWTGMEF